MPYITLYIAKLSQNGNTISASLDLSDRSPNLITGSWVTIDTGSYNFVSSGSFTGASGSITGSATVTIYNLQSPSNNTGSIISYVLDANTVTLQTSAYPMTAQLTSNVITGSCFIDIGIEY
jgi:hypothetical protein